MRVCGISSPGNSIYSEKELNSGYILKVEPREFIEGLDLGWKREKLKMILRFLAWAIGMIELHLTKMSKVARGAGLEGRWRI